MGSSDAHAVHARGLTRRFGKSVAVRPLDLAIATGEVVALVGPNGAGKTTAIRMMLGLLRPTGGEVRVLGLDPFRDRVALRRRSGFVPDHARIHPWMTVAQALDLARELHPRWDPATAGDLGQRFALPRDRRVKELSRGELAKLAFLLAASPRPELLVLDEPTSGLDPLVRHTFVQVLREIAATPGRTVLLSTHIMSDVDGVASRAVIMKDGGVLADDSVDAFKARFRKASLLFAEPPDPGLAVPGARRLTRGVRECVALFDAATAPEPAELAHATGASDVRFQPPSFEDVFLELLAAGTWAAPDGAPGAVAR